MPKVMTFEACGDLGAEFSQGEINKVPFIDKPNALLFEGGFHKGKRFGPTELDRIVNSFKKPATEDSWNVPIQIDHEPRSSFHTRGGVRNIWRNGNQIRGHLRFGGAEAVEQVGCGNWSKLSIGLTQDMALDHVAITPYPWIPNADVNGRNFDENYAMAFDESEEETVPKEKEEEVTTMTSMQKMEAEFRAQTERLATMERQMADAQAIIQTQGSTLKEQQEIIRFADITKRIDTFSAAGKTTHFMREKEMALLKTFSDEQLKLYEDYKKDQPKLTNFDTLGHVVHEKPGEGMEEGADEAADRKWAEDQAKANNYSNGGLEKK